MTQATSTIPSSLKDNRAQRGTVGQFLESKILPESVLSFVSAYFTVHAYDALSSKLENAHESLKAHLTRAVVEKARMMEPDARAGLDLLFAYTEKEHAFTPAEVATLIAAIDALKILDPACASGAFPMGVLHKLVYILGKLDPDNDRWKQTQLAIIKQEGRS